MVTFHQLILWLLSLLCRPWGCPKRLAQKCAADETEGADGDSEVCHESLWLMFSPPRCCGAGVNSDMDIERNGGLLMGTEVSELFVCCKNRDLKSQNFASFRAFLLSKTFCQHDPETLGLPNLDMRWALERNGVLVRSFQGFGCPSSVHPKGLARVQASKKWPILLENSLEGFAGFWTSFACWNTLLFLF